MVNARPGVPEVWRWLAHVPDPEVPALSVVDLGIVRDVAWCDGVDTETLSVTITPTYSGCPATRTIERDIVTALRARGVARVEIVVRLAPPWTTDWLSPAAGEKLRVYGIAPPAGRRSEARNVAALLAPPVESVACPRCRTLDTSQTSRFGSTPCKALYRCNACHEPFEYFKCH